MQHASHAASRGSGGMLPPGKIWTIGIMRLNFKVVFDKTKPYSLNKHALPAILGYHDFKCEDNK